MAPPILPAHHPFLVSNVARCFSDASENKSEQESKKEDDEQAKKKEERQQSFQKFKNVYSKPDFLKDDYDHLSKDEKHATIQNTGFDIADDEFLPDYFVQDAPTYKRNTVSINLPWLINGAPEIEI